MGISKFMAMNRVDITFCRSRKDEKYSNPMVNPDLICLYVFQYALSRKSNRQTFAIPTVKATINNDNPSSPINMSSSIESRIVNKKISGELSLLL